MNISVEFPHHFHQINEEPDTKNNFVVSSFSSFWIDCCDKFPNPNCHRKVGLNYTVGKFQLWL